MALYISSSPMHQPKPPRKIHLFNKADLQQLKKAADDFSTDFLQSDPEKRDVDTNWMISNFLNRCLSKLIPSKMSKGKRHLPWITPAIKLSHLCTSQATNYRPISLTCICCKVMEHIIFSHVSKHLASNNILTDAQHDFRQGLSTTTQLTSTVHDWSSIIQKRNQVTLSSWTFTRPSTGYPINGIVLSFVTMAYQVTHSAGSCHFSPTDNKPWLLMDPSPHGRMLHQECRKAL